MQISLRKAAALQIAISDAVKGLRLDDKVLVSIYSPDTADVIGAASFVHAKAVATRTALLDALYEIRASVGAENQTSGVSARLAQLARMERDVQFYVALSGSAPRDEDHVLDGKMRRLQSREDGVVSPFGRSAPAAEAVTVSLFTEAQIEEFTAELRGIKRRKQALQDELMELNVRATISLSENTVGALRSEHLI